MGEVGEVSSSGISCYKVEKEEAPKLWEKVWRAVKQIFYVLSHPSYALKQSDDSKVMGQFKEKFLNIDQISEINDEEKNKPMLFSDYILKKVLESEKGILFNSGQNSPFLYANGEKFYIDTQKKFIKEAIEFAKKNNVAPVVFDVPTMLGNESHMVELMYYPEENIFILNDGKMSNLEDLFIQTETKNKSKYTLKNFTDLFEKINEDDKKKENLLIIKSNSELKQGWNDCGIYCRQLTINIQKTLTEEIEKFKETKNSEGKTPTEEEIKELIETIHENEITKLYKNYGEINKIRDKVWGGKVKT